MLKTLEKSSEEFDETMIEDWLDADSHSNRLPAKFNFADMELIGELLNPNIKALIKRKEIKLLEAVKKWADSKLMDDNTRIVEDKLQEFGYNQCLGDLKQELTNSIKEYE